MRIRRFAGLAFAFIIGACFMFGIVFGSETVFAKDVTEVEKLIVDKAVYQGVYKCYNGGFVSSQIDSLANYDGDLGFLLSKKVSGENYVPLVTGISSSKIFQASRYKVRDNGLSCAQIINGGAYAFGGSNQNILQASGKTMPAKGDTNAVVDLAENFGYKVTKSGNGNCYGLRYSRINGSTTVEGDTNSVCVDGEKLTVQAGTENTSGAANRYMAFSIDGSKICLEAKGRSTYTSKGSNTTTKQYCENLNSNSDLNGQWLMDKIVAKCEYDNDAKKYSCNGHLVSNSISSTFSQNSLSNYSANFNSASNAALTAIRFLSGNDAYTSNASLGLDRVEKRMLYQDYLESYYKVNVDCSDGALGDDINWLDKTASPPAVKKCKIAAGAISNASNKTKKVNGVDSKGYFVYESLSLNDLVNEIKKMPTNYTDSELSEVESLVNSGVEGQEDGEGRCAGAGALGWFVCPVIEWLSTAAEDLYSFVEPMLQVSPQLFSGETSNVEQAWGTFRDIANVAFVILLLMVIISQITGVGIDNYGIKKILPKMIVAAILINLSYIICLIFVDLSNILGNGFQGMFNGLGSGLAPAVDIDGQGGPITDTVIPAVSVLAIVGGVAAVLANPAMILTLLVSAISVVVSLFFLFILLVSREAVIVVLVVISPLAVVCYMLPNTKSLFDRWIKILEGLLLLYPICGLLVGAGSYISKLLLSSGFGIDGFVQAFAAMIVGVVPIFFIPMVLKNSFAALGNMGAKLSGIGQGIGKSLTGAARDSDAYKNAQEMGAKRAQRIKAGMDKSGNLTDVGKMKARIANTKVGRALGYETALARGANQARKNISEQEAAGAILSGALAQSAISSAGDLDAEYGGALGNGFKGGTEGAYYGKEFLNAANAGDIARMNSVIQAMNNSNMKPKDISKLIRFAESSGAIRINDTDKAADWRGQMFRQYGNGFLSSDAELSHYMMTRGGGGRMNMNYGDYAARSMGFDDLKPEDIPKLSGESIAGLAASGRLTQGMAQRVLANNPNISEDKKIMLSAIASGNATGGIEMDANGKAILDGNGNVQYQGSIGGNSNQFKSDATTLMVDHSREGLQTIQSNGSQVDAWVANNPRDVNIVQNFAAGGSQQQSINTNKRRPGDR